MKTRSAQKESTCYSLEEATVPYEPYAKETRAVARFQNKTRQVSNAEGASRSGGLGVCPPENFIM